MKFCNIAFCVFFILPLISCGKKQETTQEKNDQRTPITVWFHSGQAGEREVIQKQIARFHEIQNEIQVKLTILPEGSYNAQVQAAAFAGKLPDLLEFDGPFLYNYVWQGKLIPLDDMLPASLKDDLLPSILEQGSYGGHLYSIGCFDSGLGLYGRRSILLQAGIRVPKRPGDAWTIEEFNHVLTRLAGKDPDGAVLDLKLNYRGEWYTYAFSPILQSAGADLIDRATYQAASAFLNSPQAVAAFEQVQSWFANGYIDPNVDDAAFVHGRVALSWVGHWEYSRYAAKFGDDLILLPLPDFSHGSKSGQGSWSWGITKKSRHPEKAFRFLSFLLRPDEVLAMTNANGAIPARRSVIARSSLYGEGGPLRLFVTQIEEGFTVPRPQTPAYPVITSAFQQAFNDIRTGGDVKPILDKAARTIDLDIRDNKGYLSP